ncbi:MAG: sigma-70 family RNA polymerase sigma factor [Planctomycetes bacterium]|nr:sigma-70 family RNA polymerase sigma factor [Planctomycetota bacterium]
MIEPSDFQLRLAAARRGERQALDALFERFYARVQAQVHQLLVRDLRDRRPWLASMFSTGDVVQEVFVRVLRDLPEFRGESEAEFVGYLAAIMKNRLRDAVRFHEALQRDRRRVQSADEEAPAARPEDPADRLITCDELARYSDALARCSQRERELLSARFDSDGEPPTFAELATRFGYPTEGAARKAFFVVKARLLARLGGDR